jgi:uncharacterized membrane protein YkvA (DUF1232 family)
MKNVNKSRSYKKALKEAVEYASDPDKLQDLLDKATEKAKKKAGALSSVWDSLMAMFRLSKAYAKGEYQETPWQSLLMVIAAIIYFVMPVDVIPDFLVGLGFLDDAAIIGWTIKTIKSDVDRFLEWEKQRAEQND